MKRASYIVDNRKLLKDLELYKVHEDLNMHGFT